MPARTSIRRSKHTAPKRAVKKRVVRGSQRTALQKIPRITYATLAVTPVDDRAYDAAVVKVKGDLGKHFSNYINGAAQGSPAGQYAHLSPVDTRIVVVHFPKGTRLETRAAIQDARCL
jgi:hypothetical protein